MNIKTSMRGMPGWMRYFISRELLVKIASAGYPSVTKAAINYVLMRFLMLVIFLLFLLWLFSSDIRLHPLMMIIVISSVFLFCYFIIDALLNNEVKRKRQHRLQFLPGFLRFLALYYTAGYSVDKSLDELSQDIDAFYPLFSKLLNKCTLSLNSNITRDSSWEAIERIIDVEQFEQVCERIRTRESHGHKVSEALAFFSDDINREIDYQKQLKLERLPVHLTFVAITCFLFSIIILMGSIVYFKLMEVFASVTAVL